MKEILSLSFFAISLVCVLLVGFYPQYCVLLFPSFFMQYIALFLQTYEVLRVRKQAVIKAYFREDSLLSKYFGRFLFVKIVSAVVALIGSVSLFFTLLFPAASDIFLLCVLVPCSIYAFKVFCLICRANISPDFATIVAKKYTALFCAFCACMAQFMLHGFTPLSVSNLQEYYQSLVEMYRISEIPCAWWQEFFGFVLLKKAIVDMLYSQNSSLRLLFTTLFVFGYFTSFMSFSLLCLSSYSPLESRADSKVQEEGRGHRALGRFFQMIFFLIFVYVAFYLSAYMQPLARSSKPLPDILASQILTQNHQYIEVSVRGVQGFVDTRDLPSLQAKLQATLSDFDKELNHATQASINEYLAKKEVIIDEYSQWYFSVYGEYTRLFYAALGRGEEIAQEQFIFLLKTYTPNDLQEQLYRVYDTHLQRLKIDLERDFSFFTIDIKPHNAPITHAISFDDINQKLDVLSPRASDGVAALLGASVVGAMILKASGKALAKTSAKLVGKSVVKKGASSAVGAGGSLVCGAFAPLCAIGFFVASDVAINRVDEELNQESFKAQMREGFERWEIQLKNSLIDYNTQLSSQIYENLKLEVQHSKE